MKKHQTLNPQTHSEECPPHQIKSPNAGDDNWGLVGTSLSVTDPKVNSGRGEPDAGSIGNTKYMRPVYNDLDSYAIHNSRTNGKK